MLNAGVPLSFPYLVYVLRRFRPPRRLLSVLVQALMISHELANHGAVDE